MITPSKDQKIHLSSKTGSLSLACRTKQNFAPKLVTDYPSKVTCEHCKKIIQSMKRSGYFNLEKFV